MTIALDATYSIGEHLSGVGVYSREILWGLAAAQPAARFLFCYRFHRFYRSFPEQLPANCHRRPLGETFFVPRGAGLFHGLNQRLPRARFRRAIATFHDLFVLTGDYSTPEFRRRFAAQAKEAAQRADLIIAVSEFTASQVEQLLGVPRARLRVVGHGVHLPSAEPEPPREDMILHVGAIQRRKNIVRLVEAFERLDGWRLVLAGSLGFGSAEILARIEASPARSRIDLLGYVPAQQLDALYRRARIFAFPSLDEGFGIPLIEAMSHGVPSLTSNRGAPAEVAGDAAILVDPESIDDIEHGLRRLVQEQPLRAEMRARGYAVAKRSTWATAVQKTWAIYREILGP